MKKPILMQRSTLLMLLLALFMFAGINVVSAQENDDGGETETITIVYESNPDEELGTFPIVPFNDLELLDRTGKLVTHLRIMRDALDGAKAGSAADCMVFTTTYETIKEESVFFDPETIPVNYVVADNLYFFSFVTALDRTRPAYFGCQNDGRVNNFDHGLAYTSIATSLNAGERALAIAEALIGDVAEEVDEEMPPMDDADMDTPMEGDAITVRWTNIYREPDPTTATGSALPPATPVDVVMMTATWAQIESELGDGYVPLNALDFDAAPPTDDEMDDGDMDDGDMDDGDMDDGDMDDETDSLEQAIAKAVTTYYIEWEGETRDPRVIDDLVDLADDPSLVNPAVVEFDAEAFFLVQFISAGSADLIANALAPTNPNCEDIINAYTLLALSPEFTDVPAEAQAMVNNYETALTAVLDKTKDVTLTCLNDGDLTDLNRAIGVAGAEAAREDFLNIAAGASLLL